MGNRMPVVAALVVALLAGVLIMHRLSSPEPSVAACRGEATSMSRLELLFGMGRKDGSEVSEAEWQAFLDAEVTPRFPDGLTVLTGYGQWTNPAGRLVKETSRVLLIWYRPAADTDARIEAIRAAYKVRFAQDSVMRVDAGSCVSF